MPNDLDIPITQRKCVRSCTQHAISYFVPYDRLSPNYRAFISNLSSIEIPKNIEEAKIRPEWNKAIDEEIRALEKNGTWELSNRPKGQTTRGMQIDI